MLHCVAVWCNALQCVAVHCSVLQCVAVCCSVLQGIGTLCPNLCRVLQSQLRAAKFQYTPPFEKCQLTFEKCQLQLFAAFRWSLDLSTLQHTPPHTSTHCRDNYSQPLFSCSLDLSARAHCNTLQRTAPHCNTYLNTRQHTAEATIRSLSSVVRLTSRQQHTSKLLRFCSP